MNIHKTELSDVYIIKYNVFKDDRGSFTKTYNKDIFLQHNLEGSFAESYYSVSKKNILRGMHFQLPPHDHVKLVHVISGKILDVVVDIRTDSPTYGQYISSVLESHTSEAIYIGKGFAHGFLTLSESATVMYSTSTTYCKESDTGILWDSFGFKWPVDKPILSMRDQQFMPMRNKTII